MKKQVRRIFNRILLTVILILIQIIWSTIFLLKLTDYSTLISAGFTILSLFMVAYIISKDDNAAYKIGWIVLIMALPLFGGLFYVCFGDKKPSKKMRRKLGLEHEELRKYMPQDENVAMNLKNEGIREATTSAYIKKYSQYPIWQNTTTKYYPVGEEMYADMLIELEKATKFILLEYFIIEEGKMWDTVLEILVRKAKEGVDVRIIYDDIGCVALLPPGYDIYVESLCENIQCMAFNPFVPLLSLVMNNRDHRKILVIDGKTAFNGGLNLADEYINEKPRFGHWKDTGVMIKGDAVWNFTLMFLETWRSYRKDKKDIVEFKQDDKTDNKSEQDHICHEAEPCESKDQEDVRNFENEGYVQPFSDTPLEDEPVAENVYIEILNQAQNYVYIYTPYLIVDNEMKIALCLAAKRGVDVRIVTPGIPDKKIIYRLTRSNYAPLIKAGIKIFEYIPGFIHAKSYLCDDKFAVVGTINMDYRSLYLHFECGTYMYKTAAVKQLKEDCLSTFEKCRQITIEDTRQSVIGKMFDAFLRILSPLL